MPKLETGRPLCRLAVFLTLMTALAAVAAPAPAAGADSAVIMMYHRFGEGAFPATNIRLDQFEDHLEELKTGGYSVLPVADIVAAIRDGRELPDRTVGLTMDDGYLSIYTEAWPRLRAAGFPFTVFVATDPIDRGFDGFMDWDQIREMQAAGVTIGGHTASHLHMPAAPPARIRADAERALTRYREELGGAPDLFAYPFGEASAGLAALVREQGYTAAFGQHSGALDASADPFYMPRFAVNEAYGDMERFRLVANALPIPYRDLSPADPMLSQNPPLFGFTAKQPTRALDVLACYAGDQGQVQVERLGPRVEVRLSRPLGPGRARINCTMPSADGRWRWLGMLYYVPPG